MLNLLHADRLPANVAIRPPEGDQWLHEVKHDGYRTELIIERGRARAYTMNGHDWTTRYPTLVAVADHRAGRYERHPSGMANGANH